MLVPIIAAASALDGITFAMAMSVVPVGYEANPIARILMESGGIAATLGWKAAVTAVVVAIAYRVRSHRAVLALIAVGYLVGASTNLISMVTT